MAGASDRRRGRGGLDAWPGYVDALSTLLMVIIFVLLVFVLAQGFLSSALSTRDRALERLNRQMAELGEMLALERGSNEELRASLARAQAEINAAGAARDTALAQLSLLREERDRLGSERDAARGEQERLAARIADLETASRSRTDRIGALERQLTEARTRAETVGGDAARTIRDLNEARRQLEALREEATRLDTQVRADRATIEARLSDLARLSEQVRALTALRDEMERQAEAALSRASAEEQRRQAAEREAEQSRAALAQAQAAGRSATQSAEQAAEEARRIAAQRTEEAQQYARLSESARAQAALLSRDLTALRAELSRLAAALEAAEAAGRDKDAQIAALGQRLNVALAARVEELQRYRSDFFGRLRDVLGDRPEIRVVGDRFVFQGEVLFPTASAELTPAGAQQIRELARVLQQIAAQIPRDIAWVLRIDGHADRNPIRSARFASNWELSAARAIAVAQLLIAEGLPANRVAAAAFGDTQPLDTADTPEALARNRRIELRLTDR